MPNFSLLVLKSLGSYIQVFTVIVNFKGENKKGLVLGCFL